MAWYDVLMRRSIIQEVKLRIEASSRVQARKDAEGRARSENLNWQSDGTVDEQPYSIQETKVEVGRNKRSKPLQKSPDRMLVIKSCSQCYLCNSSTFLCEHPEVVKKFPLDGEWIKRHTEENYFKSVLPDCPLGEIF
jgi:hypothetical protein